METIEAMETVETIKNFFIVFLLLLLGSYFMLGKGRKHSTKKGGKNNISPSQTVTNNEINEQPSQEIGYKKVNILLILRANQINPLLTIDSQIELAEAKELITNAIRAYCFYSGNEQGNLVQEKIKFSEEKIDYSNDDRIYVSLSACATSDITSKRNCLSMCKALHHKEPITIMALKKLEAATSTIDFYDI